MNIKITDFAKRHFDPKFGGTKILELDQIHFVRSINNILGTSIKNEIDQLEQTSTEHFFIYDGYADFCKLIAIENFTDTKVGSMLITLENYQYLRSGYSSRTQEELPILSRWLELPLGKPKAKWLMLVLYSKIQIDKEANITYKKIKAEYDKKSHTEVIISNITKPIKPKPFKGDWGIVAILGQDNSNEEPMKPATMLRNALGIEEGGSGVQLDKDLYQKSVDFWSRNATIK